MLLRLLIKRDLPVDVLELKTLLKLNAQIG
jgi:hypothetical protein